MRELNDMIPAEEILTAICILADKGAVMLFKKTLAELKAVSGVTIGLGELLSLAAAGCESEDDGALVNAVAGSLKDENDKILLGAKLR